MKREKAKHLIGKMIQESSKVDSPKSMLEKYKWFSLASSVKNDELTLELMKEIFQERRS